MFQLRTIAASFGLTAVVLAGAPLAKATYSIAACDAKTRECGVAVQTNNLAVGASVPYAQAGVGALVSQFETNPHYGPRGLALLAQGISPEEALKRLLAEDGNFEDEGPEARQVALVNVNGQTASHTGEEAQHAEWAGVRSGKGYTIQGNGLVGPNVLEAMEGAFLKTEGTLADKLIAALVAGDLAGGQKTGRESAALLVRTPDGWPIDIDLRVDHSSDPVADLKKIFDLQAARQQVIQASIAARKGRFDQARSLLIEGVARGSMWPRVWIRAARVAGSMEEPTLSLQYITGAFSQNSAWAEAEIGEGDFAELGASPLFHRWVSSEKKRNALSEYERVIKGSAASAETRLRVSRMLLEVGRSKEALEILGDPAQSTGEIRLARSIAYEAKGDYDRAIEECSAALVKSPDDSRLRRRIARLETERRAAQR